MNFNLAHQVCGWTDEDTTVKGLLKNSAHGSHGISWRMRIEAQTHTQTQKKNCGSGGFLFCFEEVPRKCRGSANKVPTAFSQTNSSRLIQDPKNSKKNWAFWAISKKNWKVEKPQKIIQKNMGSQANISDTPFDQNSPGHPEVSVLWLLKQTQKQTWRFYDWPGPEGRVCENHPKKNVITAQY